MKSLAALFRLDHRIAVVTGGTSGIGRATALALKDAGYTVYELSRRAEGVAGLHHISADVTVKVVAEE